ncbi:hypothetical protein FI667_g9432, partial [Globisporangium splendens]
MLRKLSSAIVESADDKIAPKYKYERRVAKSALPVKHRNTIVVIKLHRNTHKHNRRVHFERDLNERRHADAHGRRDHEQDAKALLVVVRGLQVEPDGPARGAEEREQPHPLCILDSARREREHSAGRERGREHAGGERRVHAHQVLLHVGGDAAGLEMPRDEQLQR